MNLKKYNYTINYLKKMDYIINSNKLCKSDYCEVHIIKRENNPNDLLVAKIYYDAQHHFYRNEREILIRLNQSPTNDNIIKMKTDDIHIILDNNINGANTVSIIFDYLPHENLVKYLCFGETKTDITEDMVKSIAYKLIKAISAMHKKHIIHNKLDIENIMLDEKFEPVIIHFSEATLKEEEIKDTHEDSIGLAKILAKLITNGKFSHFGTFPKGNNNHLVIYDEVGLPHVPKKFWLFFKDSISVDFQNFFKLLIKEKQINFDELLNQPWLQQFNNDSGINEETRKYFERIYELNILNEKECLTENHDFSNAILEEDKSKDNLSIFSQYDSDMKSAFDQNIYDIFSQMKIETTNFELKGIISDYLLIKLSNYDKNSSFFKKFMYKLYTYFDTLKKLEDFSISVKAPKPSNNSYLSFDININKINNNNMENLDSQFIDDDYIIPDDIDDVFEENEQTLMLNLELIHYNDINNKIENDKDTFYLVFNYKVGEISYYYHCVKIIKEKAKLILNSFFKEK